MMYYPHKTYTSQGFSLVETLVAIAILLVVIVGPMSIATNSAGSTSFANQQITAYFLAQEGLELAQKGRDDILLDNFTAGPNVAWNSFINDPEFSPCFANAGCGLEIGNTSNGEVSAVGCQNISSCRLHLSTDSGDRSRYTYSSGGGNEPTDFTRVITMDHDGDKVLVTAVVSWRTGNQIAVQSTTASTYLYNVYGR